jgi:hypothetical protein
MIKGWTGADAQVCIWTLLSYSLHHAQNILSAGQVGLYEGSVWAEGSGDRHIGPSLGHQVVGAQGSHGD